MGITFNNPNYIFQFSLSSIQTSYKITCLPLQASFEIDERYDYNSGGVKTGMIELGKNQVALYPNSGFIYSNNGGDLIFHGCCSIGNNSALAIGKNGHVEFGKNFKASTTFKLASQYHITFKDDVLFGWDCLVMDSDFHKLTKISGGYSKGYGAILVGANTWFGNGTLVLKNSIIPDFCVVGAKSLISGKVDVPSYSLVGGNPLKLIKQGVWRDPDNDTIMYESLK